jgi:hypothetical protein
MAKRTYSSAFEDEDLIEILVSDAEPLRPDCMLVQMLSQCARALPDKKQWDLRELLIEGQPVTSRTVTMWLNRGYNLIHGYDFEPSEEEAAVTAQDLYRLLAFADAVDSKKLLMEAIAKHRLDAVTFQIEVGEKHVQLALNKIYSFARSEDPELALQLMEGNFLSCRVVAVAASPEEKQSCMSQVASQVEQLLHMALRLDLHVLVKQLSHFITWSMAWNAIYPFLAPVRDQILTPRVLEAAAASPTGKAALSSSLAGETYTKCGGSDLWKLIAPINVPDALRGMLRFDAVLLEDVMGSAKGTIVPVELDLFTPGAVRRVRIGRFELLCSWQLHTAGP